ncbi:kinase-like protein [Thelephora ganbajun]|uniref:Kinase-like protein n=1 Tax=Thelephora ganbajun TaxID=370292 RepID=A0ACB6ZDY7_THEGA|nr:kinase-like protein [Thelephora ganbajun]
MVWRFHTLRSDEPIQASRYDYPPDLLSAFTPHGCVEAGATYLLRGASVDCHAIPVFMFSSILLQEVRELDASLPEFPKQLTNILLMEDWMNQAQSLPSGDLEKFVEDLDSGLNVLDPVDHTFFRCWSELGRICAAREVLPTSHILSDASLGVKNDPTTSGVVADIHEGTFKGARVRVKRVRVYIEGDPQKLKLPYHEAVVWKRIHHPNIVPFHGATLKPLQLVSDWMEYGNLMEFLKERPKANRLGLLHDVAEALNYLHSCNVVHGSIKGANILVDHFSRARVAAFTLATVYPNQDPPSDVKELHNLNTRWTAPEVLEEKEPLTKKADIFSFAMLTVEMFAGTVPFHSIQSVTSVIKIIHGDRPPRPTDPLLTDGVWTLICRCWDQSPQSRPEMTTVLQHIAPSLLRSLHQFNKSLPEFQVALSQFYDGTEWKGCIDPLRGAELKEFIDFLDDVLRVERLSEDLRRRTLHNLREVCGERAILPESCMVFRQFSKLTAEPCAVSKYAEVWKGQTGPGEGGNSTMDVCIKAINLENVHKKFRGEVAQWVKLDHPNILQCFGVTFNPLQIVMEWMPNGQALEYAKMRAHADRVCLLIDVARGLDYLHSLGVIHGNLKQQNILVNSTGRARLSDIGFAKLIPIGESRFDWVKVSADGCRWVAPEIFHKGEFTKQSDVFSYGFIAAEIFTGKILWEGIDEMEVRSKILGGKRPSWLEGDEHTLAVELWRICSRCWGKDPGGRSSVYSALNALQCLPQQFNASYISEKVTQGEVQSSQECIDELDKMLDANMIFPKERPRILNRLCKMCDLERSLPTSMVIAPASLRIKSTLAQDGGGSADVYRGEYHGCSVAIKVMRLYVKSDCNLFFSRFCREAVAWRHLRHPNILPLLGATLDLQASRPALVSKWMNNGNINSFVRNRGDVNRAQLLVDVAHGLQYLHRLNFVHGDLKGVNILIKNDHRACLADFGLSTIIYVAPHVSNDVSSSTEVSRVSVDSTTSLMSHSSGGTIRWMSPELLHPGLFGLEDSRPTKQSDCYALGMVIYEVLRGKVPYWDHKGNVMQAILDGKRPSKPDAAATLGFTDGLWRIVEYCWLEDRGMRPDVKTILSRLTDAAWAWDMRR